MRRNEVLTHTGTRMDIEDTMLSDILNQISSDQSLSRVRLNSEVKVAQLCLTPCDPMDCSPPGSSVHGIFQEEYWNGLPCPPPGDLPDPVIKLVSLKALALAGGFVTTRATWED